MTFSLGGSLFPFYSYFFCLFSFLSFILPFLFCPPHLSSICLPSLSSFPSFFSFPFLFCLSFLPSLPLSLPSLLSSLQFFLPSSLPSSFPLSFLYILHSFCPLSFYFLSPSSPAHLSPLFLHSSPAFLSFPFSFWQSFPVWLKISESKRSSCLFIPKRAKLLVCPLHLATPSFLWLSFKLLIPNHLLRLSPGMSLVLWTFYPASVSERTLQNPTPLQIFVITF